MLIDKSTYWFELEVLPSSIFKRSKKLFQSTISNVCNKKGACKYLQALITVIITVQKDLSSFLGAKWQEAERQKIFLEIIRLYYSISGVYIFL